MSLIILVAVQAAASPDCDAMRTPVAANECRLAQSMEQLPELDCEDQQTQLAMNVCSYRAHLRSDIELNHVWEQASDHARSADRWAAEHGRPQGEFERLLAAQRHWIAFRDAHCALKAGPREVGGSIWPLVMSGCLTNLTQARTAQLREYMEPMN